MSDTNPHLRHAVLEWAGDLRFTAGAAGDGPRITIDPQNVEGPSPVVTMLIAAGACSGADVVDILRKGKVNLTRCSVEVTGRRNEEYPKRYNELWLTFRLSGEGITQANADRAVQLSTSKYCSVLLSLNPDIPVRAEAVIE